MSNKESITPPSSNSEAVDPSVDEYGSHNKVITTSTIDVSLDDQLLEQRRWIFRIVLGVALLMYLAVGVFLFCSHFFRILILAQPYSISIVVALLIIPSMLLWSLISAVYKAKTNTDNGDESILSKFFQDISRYLQRKI